MRTLWGSDWPSISGSTWIQRITDGPFFLVRGGKERVAVLYLTSRLPFSYEESVRPFV